MKASLTSLVAGSWQRQEGKQSQSRSKGVEISWKLAGKGLLKAAGEDGRRGRRA